VNDVVRDARALVAFSNMALDWTFEASERELRQAAQREPNSAETLSLYATYLCTVGRTDEGLAAAQAAMTGDPLNPIGSWIREECLYKGRRYAQVIADHAKMAAEWPDPRFYYWDTFLGAAYREKGQFKEAIAEYERAQQAAGDMPLFGYAVTLARAGQMEKAKAVLAKMLAYSHEHYLNPIAFVAVYAALGDREQTFAWLDRTVVDRTGWLWGIGVGPDYDALRGDPRLDQLVRRMGVPANSKKTGS